MFIIIGGMTYGYVCRTDLRVEDINFFVCLLLVGYLALRNGFAIAHRIRLFNKIIHKSKGLFPLSDRIELQSHTFCLLISIFFSLGMFAFFMYFHNFPALHENPAVARYLYFNGPYTSGLTRFFYRIFLSGTEIAVTLLIYVELFTDKKGRSDDYILHIFTVLAVILGITMLSMNASRGPIFRVIIFSLLAYSGKISRLGQTMRLLTGMLVAFILLFSASVYRFSLSYTEFDLKNIGAILYPFFPEVAEGSMVIGEFRSFTEPLLMGRTFLSGALVFIPSSLFAFRQQYDINRYTLEILNVQTESAGGIRITTIGEAYINFGITGVIVILVLNGFLLAKVYQAFRNSSNQPSYGFIFLASFLVTAPIFSSSLFFLLYAAIGIGFMEKYVVRVLKPGRRYKNGVQTSVCQGG